MLNTIQSIHYILNFWDYVYLSNFQKIGLREFGNQREKWRSCCLQVNCFMVTFTYMADFNRVFEGRPYFYNQVGLFVKPWHVGFNPSEELPNWILVWVWLPIFPIECCWEDVLHMLSSMLRNLVGPSTQTLGKKVMTFARICVEVDLSRPLLDAVEISASSYSWVQQLDYKTLTL